MELYILLLFAKSPVKCSGSFLNTHRRRQCPAGVAWDSFPRPLGVKVSPTGHAKCSSCLVPTFSSFYFGDSSSPSKWSSAFLTQAASPFSRSAMGVARRDLCPSEIIRAKERGNLRDCLRVKPKERKAGPGRGGGRPVGRSESGAGS